MQPAAAVGLQERARRGEQVDRALWIVLGGGLHGQPLKVVGGACLISCLGRE
jgi:hypothetical protein